MKQFFKYFIIFLILPPCLNNAAQVRHRRFDNERDIRKFLCTEYERRATEMCHAQALAEWEHEIDLTNATKAEKAINASMSSAQFDQEVYESYFKDIDIDSIENHDIARQIRKASNIGYAALRPELLEELTKILSDMQRIYSTAKICPYKMPKCNITVQGISFTPDVERIMADSMDYDELLYTWISWHEATGAKIRKPFEFYVVLANEAAIANNFSDRGEMWRNEYETDNFEAMIDTLWSQVEPLYVDLHTFARHRLREVYHKELDAEDDGLIPAHLLGNMWAQSWLSLKDLLIPYPNNTMVDITEIFQAQNISVPRIFELANDFYKSMGLLSMDSAFDPRQGAVITKPPANSNRTMICHASAWDFCTGADFRIKMCAQNTFEDFITIHHELGHVQYFMWYRQQPILYRDGANPSFHEAIGDMLALSVITPGHFQRLNLLPAGAIDHRHGVNMLMNLALVKVAFLPFGYLLDKWRWDIFGEKIDPEKWNDHFWSYRMKYQRVKAPIVRSHEDFDPGGKFHVCADSQYISYFLAHILEFQIHKSLCATMRDNEQPLHECDLQGNRLAGHKLKHAMKMGASRHWSYVLKDLTGDTRISADAIIEYFAPLTKFLKKANAAYSKYKMED